MTPYLIDGPTLAGAAHVPDEPGPGGGTSQDGLTPSDPSSQLTCKAAK